MPTNIEEIKRKISALESKLIGFMKN